MTSTNDLLKSHAGSGGGFLDRERTIAQPGFNRWLVPPAALAIHLCIGMAYGFSVFWLPLSQSLGIGKSVACPADSSILTALFTTSCDWSVADLGWMFTLFFVLLGSSAALWGELAGARGATQGGFRRGVVLVWRPRDFLDRRAMASTVDALGWFGRYRRRRPWPRLHLPRLDAGEMVPGSSRHGDRHGDHGLWRRRDDRFAACESADE